MTPNLTLLTNDDLAAILSAPHIGDRAKANARAELARRKRAGPKRAQQVTPVTECSPSPTARTIVLPWRVLVSVNARQNPASGFTLTRAYRKALKEAKRLASEQWKGEPIDGDIRVTLTFYPPSRRMDLPNYIKLPMDALEGVAYVNDKQANAGGGWEWGYVDKLDPRVVITVRPLADEAVA